MQNRNIFKSFSPNFFSTIFLVKSNLSTAKKCRTATLSSWQKLKISNSVLLKDYFCLTMWGALMVTLCPIPWGASLNGLLLLLQKSPRSTDFITCSTLSLSMTPLAEKSNLPLCFAKESGKVKIYLEALKRVLHLLSHEISKPWFVLDRSKW